MSIRVVAIHSSPRKRNTWRVLQQLAQRLAEHGIELDIIDLNRHDIEPCLGCSRCVEGKACPRKDGVGTIMERMAAADGLVLSTPLFVYTVSGQLKVFLDRTIELIHRPRMTGKPGLGVCTVMGSPMGPVRRYLDEVLIGYGMQPMGFIGRKVQTMDQPVHAGEIEAFVGALKGRPERHRPSFMQLNRFAVQKALAMKVLTEDRAYWVARGWDRTIYYHPCRIGPIKALWARLFYALLASRMRPYQGGEPKDLIVAGDG